MSDTSFTLLDVDWGGAGASWQDLLTVTNSGATLTSVNPSFTTVSGNTVLGMSGNVPSDSTDGNVNVSIASIISAITMIYGPGPVDGFGSNQLVGISNISITTALVDMPEPSTITLFAAGALLLMIGMIRRF